MRILILLIFILTPPILSAQTSIKEISLSITTGVYDDSLKVVAIAKWIIKNLEYDYGNMDNATDIARATPSVLKRKKAVCEGYMNLFEALCKASNIQAVSIKGYTDDEKRKKDPKVNHGWNAVKINGQWYLMDITWADNGDDYDDIVDEYLWSDPIVFLKKHFPENAFWQLLEKPISLDCFIWDSNCPDWSCVKKASTTSTDKAIALEDKIIAQQRMKQKEQDKKYKTEQKNTELYNTAWAYKTKAYNFYKEYISKKSTENDVILLNLLKDAISNYEASNKYFGDLYHKTGVLHTEPINNNADRINELKKYIENIEQGK
jgi:hypothetical protein